MNDDESIEDLPDITSDPIQNARSRTVSSHRREVSGSQNPSQPSLFEVIKTGSNINVEHTVSRWIEAYEQDQDVALLELMRFIFQSCGCKDGLTTEMQMRMKPIDIVEKMAEYLDKDMKDYPLVRRGPEWSMFGTNFGNFFHELILQCQRDVIYDGYLIDDILSLLNELSFSKIRTFRHTATLAALKLTTALVSVTEKLSGNLTNSLRICDAEDAISAAKLERLSSKVQKIKKCIADIECMLNPLFRKLFEEHSRDVCSEIRCICSYEFGLWVKMLPDFFLNDHSLKYVGMTLDDENDFTCLNGLQVLQSLYAPDQLVHDLESFTDTYKEQILTMMLDENNKVAMTSVKLITNMYTHHEDHFTQKDRERVYELIFNLDRGVAQAAGEFLHHHVFKPDVNAVPDVTKSGKRRRPNTPLIRKLVKFLIQNTNHKLVAYLVDSLIESNPMLTDWPCMTELLLEEPGPREEPLTDQEETSLVNIMTTSLLQTATGKPPEDRKPHRKPTGSSREFTKHFIMTLPLLLEKYLADVEKITKLMLIPQHFELDVYFTDRQEKNLDALLQCISNIVVEHSDTAILKSCARTYDFMCDKEISIYSRCEASKKSVINLLINNYKESASTYLQANSPTNDEIQNVSTAMKKLATFSTFHDLSPWNIRESLYNWVRSRSRGNDLPAQVVKYAIGACIVDVMWNRIALKDPAATPVEVLILHDKLSDYIECLRQLLNDKDYGVKEEAFLSICDLLLAFSDDENGKFEVYEADEDLIKKLNAFVQSEVFTEYDKSNLDEETCMKQLNQRRNLLDGFCKLVIYNVISMRCAVDVFKQFDKWFQDFGDIIEEMLKKCKEINYEVCARTMVTALSSIFGEIRRFPSTGRLDRHDEHLNTAKQLAKRFAGSFEMNKSEDRNALVKLHRKGIRFAIKPLQSPINSLDPPPNLTFLEVLAEFCGNLLPQDKTTVLDYLDRHITTKWVEARRSLLQSAARKRKRDESKSDKSE